jgi:hypothetical protein
MRARATGDLDRLAAAVFAGDDRAANRVIAQIAGSDHIRKLEQWGRELLTEGPSQDVHQQDTLHEPLARGLSI